MGCDGATATGARFIDGDGPVTEDRVRSKLPCPVDARVKSTGLVSVGPRWNWQEKAFGFRPP